MNYYLIYGTESGMRIKQFPNKYQAQDYLDEYFSDHAVKFLDKFPDQKDYFDYSESLNSAILICGEVKSPKAVTIIKQYEIE